MARKEKVKEGELTNKEIAERWERFRRSLSADLLDPEKYSDEEIGELIREAGGDPDAIDKRSREQAHKLWARWSRTK